jgi:hypothetical protein
MAAATVEPTVAGSGVASAGAAKAIVSNEMNPGRLIFMFHSAPIGFRPEPETSLAAPLCNSAQLEFDRLCEATFVPPGEIDIS